MLSQQQIVTLAHEVNQRASAFFAGVIRSVVSEIAELQSYRNKQTDRTTLRSAVRRSSEGKNIRSNEQEG